jgi:hypothetical protein
MIANGRVLRNPFASRFVRPGAIPFQFPFGIDATSLLIRLDQFNWRASIIGPHGSGKSTLLAELTRELLAAGRAVHATALHDRQRRLPREFFDRIRSTCDPSADNPKAIAIVDGYEQLSYWSRRQLNRRCRVYKAGLLITAHAPTTLPILFRTSTSLDLAMAIIDRLLLPSRLEREGPACRELVESGVRDIVGESEIRQAWIAHRGNLREMLFELYDLFERRRMHATADNC